MNQQTVIPLEVGADDTLSTFVQGNNQALLSSLKALIANEDPTQATLLYIFGAAGVGKTHLLRGAVAQCERANRPARYLRLDNQDQLSMDVVQADQLICADNLNPATMSRDDAIRLLSLFEAVGRQGATLIIAAQSPPESVGQVLPDLASRLASGTTFPLHPLDDEGKRMALKQRAEARGFELQDDVVAFILRHYARDTTALFTLMDRIDSASLASHRRVTIPFIRELIQPRQETRNA